MMRFSHASMQSWAPPGACVALCVTALLTSSGCDHAHPGVQGSADPVIHDRPIGQVPTARINKRLPEPWERQQDSITAPYNLLVTALNFEDLSPVELTADQVQVPGARSTRLEEPGTVVVMDIEVGSPQVTLLSPDHATSPGAPTGVSPALSRRSAVPLARHALTTCEILIIQKETLMQEVTLKGVLRDSTTGEPIERGSVSISDNLFAVSDAEGRWSFDEPYPLSMLFQSVAAHHDYEVQPLSAAGLTRQWVETWHETGDAVITLRPNNP